MNLILKCSLCLSFIITASIYSIATSVIPPMTATAPNCPWTGIAKSLIILSNLASHSVVLPFLFVGIAIVTYLILRFIENAVGEENTTRIFALFTILSLFLLVFWLKQGTESIQDQMVDCMGLRPQ